jgi:hypothetical protein
MPGLAADAARNIKQRYPLHEGCTSMTAGSGAVPRDISGQCAPAISARRWRTSVCGQLRGKKQGLPPHPVMRKLLHALHGLLTNDQPFDNTRFYAMPKENLPESA